MNLSQPTPTTRQPCDRAPHPTPIPGAAGSELAPPTNPTMTTQSESLVSVILPLARARMEAGAKHLVSDMRDDAAAERAGLCRCASCDAVFKMPAIGRCPSCESSQIRRIDEKDALIQEMAATLRAFLDHRVCRCGDEDIITCGNCAAVGAAFALLAKVRT